MRDRHFFDGAEGSPFKAENGILSGALFIREDFINYNMWEKKNGQFEPSETEICSSGACRSECATRRIRKAKIHIEGKIDLGSAVPRFG